MPESNAPPETKDLQPRQRRFRWYAVLLSASWAFCAAWYLAPPDPETVEHLYSRGVYRLIANGVMSLTGGIPFSVFFTAIALAVPAFVIVWGLQWRRRRRLGHGRFRALLWGPKWGVLLLSLAMVWFLVFWGMGYQRLPIEYRLQLDSSQVLDSEVEHLLNEMLAIIRRDMPMSSGDRDVNRAITAISQAMESMIVQWGEPAIRLPEKVKATPPGLLLLNGTSGICIPFTLEAHVDGALPDTAFIAVAAHELGHLAGICDEGETSLAGYVAGLRAEDAYARYAVALDIYKNIAARLGRERHEDAMRALPETARADVQRARDAGREHRIEWLQRWSWRAYNQFLKSQGVEEGVKSYGRSVELLAFAWRAGHLPMDTKAAENPEILSPPALSDTLQD